jgi:DnaJ-class molecular chaperone
VKLKVPAGSSSGRKLRLKGKGLPDLKGGARGDLYAVVQVMVPAQTKEAEAVTAAAAEQIDKLYAADVRQGLKL